MVYITTPSTLSSFIFKIPTSSLQKWSMICILLPMMYNFTNLPPKKTKSLHKSRACHGWRKCHSTAYWLLSIGLNSGKNIFSVNKSRIYIYYVCTSYCCIHSSRDKLHFNAEIEIFGHSVYWNKVHFQFLLKYLNFLQIFKIQYLKIIRFS